MANSDMAKKKASDSESSEDEVADAPDEQLSEDEEEEEKKPPFTLEVSRGCEPWLRAENMSIALTTYQAGKILFFGVRPEGQLWVHNRNIGRCLGVAVSQDARTFYCTSLACIYEFHNILPEGELAEEIMDALYIPQMAYYTADLDVHDLAIDENGELLFVNTLFNCVAKLSKTHSFEAIWKPPFISGLVAEDRCHLNGMALKDGKLKYVTMISDTDTMEAWRNNRWDGGLIMDTDTNEIVAKGLSMPHSPRYYRDKLWVLNSGRGEFGFINSAGEFEAMTFCPGYLRGLSFHGDYAIVGLSMPRENKAFTGLPLDDALKERKIESRCGVYVIDIRTGAIANWFTIGGVISELYDVVCMPNVKAPGAISPLSNEDLQRHISVGVHASE